MKTSSVLKNFKMEKIKLLMEPRSYTGKLLQ